MQHNPRDISGQILHLVALNFPQTNSVHLDFDLTMWKLEV